MLKRRLLVISLAALCLSTAPTMADFVEINAGYSMMSVTDTSGGSGTSATATVIGTSTMNMNIKNSDGSIQQSIIVDPSALDANLEFIGLGGNDYTASGSLEMYDDSDDTKIAADFASTTLNYNYSFWHPILGDVYTMTLTGYLTPQNPNTSILLGGSPWKFVGTDGTLSLAGDPADFDHGLMVVFEYSIPYGSMQDFFIADGDASGMLFAEIHSTPIPAAVLLGVIGLGVAGLKLRKYA